MASSQILPLFIGVPLGAAFILPLFTLTKRARRAPDLIAFIVAVLLAVGSAALIGGPNATYWMGKWAPPLIGISLVCDGLSRLLLLTVNIVSLCAILFSFEYMERYTAKPLYYSLFLLMVGGMNGVVLSGDMFNMYVFLEVSVIASYSLVAFGCESEELEAAFKYLVLGSLSSAFILLGVGLLYNLTGALNMAQIARELPDLPGSSNLVLLISCFFLMGFGLKAAMVPFHAWLPDAHPSAPAPISAMLSGVLIKAVGVYGLCRVMFDVIGVTAIQANILIALGALSMVVGVFLAVGQWDFKRLLAYHSISQMGYVVLAVGVGGALMARGEPGDRAVAALAIFGGMFHLINHAAFKSLLFLCSGAIEYRTGTRQLKELGGLRRNMPLTSGCCRIAALSISGVPPFNGFFSKLIIIVAVIKGGYYLLGAMTVLVSFLTLVSFVKVQRYILDGEPHEKAVGAREVPYGMCAAMVLLAVACCAMGILLPLYKPEVLDPAREAMLSLQQYVQLALGK